MLSTPQACHFFLERTTKKNVSHKLQHKNKNKDNNDISWELAEIQHTQKRERKKEGRQDCYDQKEKNMITWLDNFKTTSTLIKPLS